MSGPPDGLDDHTIAIWLRPDELNDLYDMLAAQGFRLGLRWPTLTCVRDQLAVIIDEADER